MQATTTLNTVKPITKQRQLSLPTTKNKQATHQNAVLTPQFIDAFHRLFGNTMEKK